MPRVKSKTETPGSQDTLDTKPLPKTFSYKDEFKSGSYKIIITTNYLNDTLSDYYSWEAVSWPIVKNQEIQFIYKDSLYTKFDFPTKRIWKKTRKGKSVKSAEIIMWNANFIKGPKTNLFFIREASGLCVGASCPTYSGVFELSGKPVYQVYNYGRENHILITGKGKPQNGLTYKELIQKLGNIEKTNDITKEMINESYKSEKDIGIIRHYR